MASGTLCRSRCSAAPGPGPQGRAGSRPGCPAPPAADSQASHRHAHTCIERQVVIVYAATQGYSDKLSLSDILPFQQQAPHSHHLGMQTQVISQSDCIQQMLRAMVLRLFAPGCTGNLMHWYASPWGTADVELQAIYVMPRY